MAPTATGPPFSLHAETEYEAWLSYLPLSAVAAAGFESLPACVVLLDDSNEIQAAQHELTRGARGMLGRTLRLCKSMPAEPAIVLGTLASVQAALPFLTLPGLLSEDGHWLIMTEVNGFRRLVVTALSDRGVIYGAFALLRKIALEQDVSQVDEKQEPYAPIRWVNQWDNLNGTTERGYGGSSIFLKTAECGPI